MFRRSASVNKETFPEVTHFNTLKLDDIPIIVKTVSPDYFPR